ncbi:chromate transporter [Paenibacillus sp. 1011MAR3C5]|uniref:chromate transporter n=1 Tax=Paenibacillus sp. 1011MAR3C5 TaxID=1675787 RepID=UPI000E6CFA40|nr:chromate transporter [Paenibacillus sp. 1011MAR3C5]RJE86163.1 chromate transporter [Paenibacillus sp. 1011MAR3C5]
MQPDTQPSMLHLFWTFLKLSPVSFGGGYAIFPALEREIVDKRHWMSSETLTDTLSLASAAPGGVGVNAAILLGYRLHHWRGALAACAGSILPSFLIVLALYAVYAKIGPSAKAEAALTGITWGVMTLILFSAFRIGKSAIKDRTTLILLLLALIGLLLGLAPVYIIVAGIATGMFYAWFRRNRRDIHATSSVVKGGKQEDPAYMYFI